MFERIWSYITLKFKKEEPSLAVRAVPYSHKRHESVPAHPPRSLLALANAQLHAAQEQAHPEFSLVLDCPSPPPLPQKQLQER